VRCRDLGHEPSQRRRPGKPADTADNQQRKSRFSDTPNPTDRRAKLIVLTDRGKQSIAAGIATIDRLEDQTTAILGERDHRQLRTLLGRLLKEGQIS
jgi:hypothetical protein